MSVDILPASNHFSSALLPYLESLVKRYTNITNSDNSTDTKVAADGDEYTRALDRATIAENGKLVGKHGRLQEAVDKIHAVNTNAFPNDKEEGRKQQQQWQPASQMGILRKKKLLMLGSGMVAGPAVDVIAKRGDVQLVIGESSRMHSWVVMLMDPFLCGL